MTRPTPEKQQPQKPRLLADFIHELNIVRRNLSLYPPSHPQITTSTATALKVFNQLCGDKPMIKLGVAPETLFFESTWLDRNNPVFNKYAHFLSNIGIAALCFRQGVTADELIRFNQLLRSDRETVESCGGFKELLKRQQIYHIELTPIDYGAFQATRKSGIAGQHLWEDFLQGLLHNVLALEDGDEPLLERFDPQAVAELINRRMGSTAEETGDYQQAISAFVSRLTLSNPGEPAALHPGEQLGKLLLHLNPHLRRQFLSSAYAALEQNPEHAEKILENFPRELLLETFEQQGAAQIQIPSRLAGLVNRLSAQAQSNSARWIKGAEEGLDKEMVRARLEVLFHEENQDQYMPGSYQKALQTIFDDDLSDTLPEDEKQLLKHTLEQQSVERQCCYIIFELLQEKPDPATEEALQNNLVELSRFFLDTGDFGTLAEIHRRWAEYLNSGLASTSVFNEKVLTNQTQLTFMTEVLDGFELWGKEKHSEINSYIQQVGEPYTEPLIERLALEPKMSQRRSWMKLLEGIGPAAYPKIIKKLQDKRWYLIRNLVIILGRHADATVLKSLQQLADHPHPRVRQELLKLLFQRNSAIANRLLLKELTNRNPDALHAAIQMAELSRDESVVTALHRLLTAEMQADTELEQKKLLLSTLARIGRSESLPILRSLLQRKGLLLSRRQKDLQHATIKALAEFPRALGEPLLRELVRGSQRQQAKLAEEQLRLMSRGTS